MEIEVTDLKQQKHLIYSISFVSFMVSLDTYIVNISLPTIAESFGVSTGEISWVVLSYLLAVTGTLLIFGKLGDKFGLKKIFITGFGIFILGSLICGIAPNLAILIAARALQGIGGSMLLGMAPALFSRYLPKNKRGEGFGLYATFAALGITIGAPLGGFITGFFSWHWIFLINIPVGLVAIVICMKVIPSISTGELKNDNEKFDYLGSILSLFSSLFLLYALNMGQEKGWSSPLILGLIAASIILFTLFIFHIKKVKNPLLDPSLFKKPAFTAGNIASGFAVAFLAGHNFLIPFYLEYIQKLETQKAGLVILVYSIVYMAGGVIAGKLSDKIHPRVLCMWGMALGTVTAVIFALKLSSPGLLTVILFLGFLALSYAMFVPSSNNLVMSTADEGKHGTVSGVFRMGIYLFMAIGVCVFETIFAGGIQNGGIQNGGISGNYDKVPVDLLVKGFQFAYAAGGIACLLALVSVFFAKDK